MNLEFNIPEIHSTSISYNIKQSRNPNRWKIGIEQVEQMKEFFAEWFSKKVGSVQYIFNLKKNIDLSLLVKYFQ